MSLDSQDSDFEKLLAASPQVVGNIEVWESGKWLAHAHSRHQFIYAIRGVLHVQTEGRSWVLPTSRALWISAGTVHSLNLKRPAEIVVLYVDSCAFNLLQGNDTIVVEMTPLARELMRACAGGYEHYELDSEKGRLARVLLDQAKHLRNSPAEIPLPRDRRARHLAEILHAEPDNRESLDQLASRVGASARTVTRLFLDET